MHNVKFDLLDDQGKRKYLTKAEWVRFCDATRTLPTKVRMYCMTLLYSGARRQEALGIRRMDVDVVGGDIAVRTLKQRGGRVSYRRVPVPEAHLLALDMVFDLRRGKKDERLWPVTNRTANRWIDDAMLAAGIEGHSPKSLRHTFGITMVMGRVPLPLIQKMMGHSDLEMTAIYTTPVGEEAKEQAKLTWQLLEDRKEGKW
jgi:integrase/recombinase XerD